MADRLSRGRLAVVALAAIVVTTAAWWALALWPVPAEVPGWLARARYVCFGSLPEGGPDVAGWLVLLGQPVGMLGVLLVAWGEDLARGLAECRRHRGGRLGLALGAGVVAGTLLLGARQAWDDGERFDPGSLEAIGTLGPLDRDAPPLALVDQAGDTIRLVRFRGRPVLITFAFAHCAVTCPTVVEAVLAAQRDAPAPQPAVVIVTLDPWRDPPARLQALAQAWRLGPGAHVLSGSVADVEATLDAWGVVRTRDTVTGEVHHPVVVLVAGGDGRLAYSVPGYAQAIREALRQLPRQAARTLASTRDLAGY